MKLFNVTMYEKINSKFDNNKYFYFEKDTVYKGKSCFKTILKFPFDNFEGYLKSMFLIEKSTKKILKSSTFTNILNLRTYEEMSYLSINFIEDISEDSFGRKVFKDINKPPLNRDSLFEEVLNKILIE